MAELAIGAPPRLVPETRSFWVAPPLLILAALFFYPLLLIARQALGDDQGVLSLAHFGEVLGSRIFHDALRHTLVIALSATAGCLVIGFLLSVLIAFTPFPGSQVVARLIDTFIALPTFLVARPVVHLPARTEMQ